MAFDDRLVYLFVGMAIGFVLGRFTNFGREIKEELDEVDEIVKKTRSHENDQGGFIKPPWASKIALLLVVGLTAWAALTSQKAVNDEQDAQRSQIEAQRIQNVTVYCTKKVLTEALLALNERSTYTRAQTNSNVDLQTDFAKFFNLLLHQPPYTPKKRLEAAKEYQKSLNQFVHISVKARHTVENNPFPTNKELGACLARRD